MGHESGCNKWHSRQLYWLRECQCNGVNMAVLDVVLAVVVFVVVVSVIVVVVACVGIP